MFTDAFSRDYQLIKADPRHSLYLACALMVRGSVELSDIRRNIDRYFAPKLLIIWKEFKEKWSLYAASFKFQEQTKKIDESWMISSCFIFLFNFVVFLWC